MRSIGVLLLSTMIIGAVQAQDSVQSRDLYMAPPKGWITTRDRVAWMTFRGQVAQGLFEKMPENSTVKDPNATCAPTGIVKMMGGVLCTHWPAKDPRNAKIPAFYECEINIDLDTGEMVSQGELGMCGEDESTIQEQRKDAKKKGYWWINN